MTLKRPNLHVCTFQILWVNKHLAWFAVEQTSISVKVCPHLKNNA